MKINVCYYSYLREKTGKQTEVLDLNVIKVSANVSDLYDYLDEKYGFSFSKKHLRVAINDRYAAFEEKLCEGDKLVFITPLSGG